MEKEGRVILKFNLIPRKKKIPQHAIRLNLNLVLKQKVSIDKVKHLRK